MSITETIDAMRAARGSEELTAKQWLDALGIAGGAIKFGRLLSEHIDTRAGVLLEYRLFGRYDSHVKRWTFRVWTDEDVAAAGRGELRQEERGACVHTGAQAVDADGCGTSADAEARNFGNYASY